MRIRLAVTALVMPAVLVLFGCERPEAPPPVDDDTDDATAAPHVPEDMTLMTADNDAMTADYEEKAARLINDGLRYLLTRRNDNGGWDLEGRNEAALTAMAVKALVQHPDFDAESAVVSEGLARMLEYRQDDGGIYNPPEGRANYDTSLAVMAMAAVESPEYNAPLREAVAFLRGIQIVPGTETPTGDIVDEDHPFYGGVSYGRHGRPDMSNLTMWMQAMHDAGVEGDDPAMQRALRFVERTQNRSESNPMPWVQEGPDDGGFVYAPATAGDLTAGETKAGPGPGGRGLRSYGSMTYAGFKSMLYAGVDRDDERVRAAFEWIREYWRLDSNPNMPQLRSQQGLYYYYHVFAKALRAWGQPVITDFDGNDHNWRHELIDHLAERVDEDGSWSNDQAERWHEGQPVLCTAYAVLALQEAME